MTALDATVVTRDRSLGSQRSIAAVVLPSVFVAFLVVLVAVPDAIATHGPNVADSAVVLSAPSGEHWFGTDQLGRDVFSRVVHGARYSVLIGLGATAVGVIAGTVVGLAAALAPRGVDVVAVRLIDVLLAFPELLLALLVMAVLGPSPENTLIAVGAAATPGYARLIRSQALRVKRSGYVEQAVTLGIHPVTIVRVHLVPNVIRPLLVLATIGIGSAILSASALSFLGLGVPPPLPEWGAQLADGRSFLQRAPWMSLFPASFVALTVISITVLGRTVQARIAGTDG